MQANTSLDAAMRALFGRDIWLNAADGQNGDRIVTTARDWRLVEGEEAVRQSLFRRLMTKPGEWKTKPNYGVGASSFVKRPATSRTTDELAGRIVTQYHVDRRVEQVSAVTADWAAGLLRLAIVVKLRGRDLNNQPLIVSAQVR